MQESIKTLHVILKTAERCNLACSYCYFFFGGDESYLRHSPIIKHDVILKTAAFLAQGAKELNIQNINIYFHGGEPLLQKKADFDKMCTIFRERFSCLNLYLSIQTNAVLLDRDWIELFRKHNVAVGISIDGNKEIHDKYRVDHKGHGSYEKTKKGIDLLKEQGFSSFGGLSVITPQTSGKEVYYHLTRELGFDHFDFLLPDNNYGNKPDDLDEIGIFLCDAFKAWSEDNNPEIRIRFFSSILLRLLGRHSGFINFGPLQSDSGAITISSDGDLSPDDTLRSTAQTIIHTGKTIYDVSLRQFLANEVFDILENAKTKLPNECQKCVWKNICAGGEPVNRYSKDKGFDSPSIYCKSLKKIYEMAARHLLKNNANIDIIAKVLDEN